MSEIINLNKARKARGKAAAKDAAARNRARFGRTAAEKALERAEREKTDRLLDGARLTPDE